MLFFASRANNRNLVEGTRGAVLHAELIRAADKRELEVRAAQRRDLGAVVADIRQACVYADAQLLYQDVGWDGVGIWLSADVAFLRQLACIARPNTVYSCTLEHDRSIRCSLDLQEAILGVIGHGYGTPR